MIHERSTLAEFQEGEQRFVYARYLSDEVGLYRLEDGSARGVRAFVKAELCCPVPNCPQPPLTTSSRREHRDHFKHLQGNFGHAAESYFHVEAKAQIGAWVRARYPDATVVEEQPSNAQRERIADVMVTLAGGERIAIEIQYSKLPADQWRERHLSYKAQGIHDVWLFGHVGAQMRIDRDEVRIGETQRAVAEQEKAVLWFNPLTRLVGTAYTFGHPFNHATYEGSGSFLVQPLDQFTVDPVHGLSNRSTRNFLAGALKQRRWEAELAAQRAADAEKEREKLAAAAAKAALEAETREAMLGAWFGSAEGKALSDRFPVWPEYLNVVTSSDLPVPRQMWQAWVLVNVVEETEPGERVGFVGTGDALREEFGLANAEVLNILSEFFAALVRAGILTKVVKKQRYGGTKFFYRRVARITPIVLDGGGLRAAPARRLSGRGYLPESDLLAAVDRAPQVRRPGRVCETCGLPLAKLMSGRFHIGPCDPEYSGRR
ncbi:hypothetical protein ABIB15_002527 [Marisediminicola sp. UYEF4]|uniref:competence protein CoiA family protein n=1 Tax=Marisediminicola sp. UYEF4 TaxID=1756384 RepID=UPI0033934F26